jgi:uncharacterized protein DUF433
VALARFDSQIDSQTAVSTAKRSEDSIQLEDYFEFLEPDAMRIKGHRIGIESILRRYVAGEPVEEIARHFDTLRPVDIYATVTYLLPGCGPLASAMGVKAGPSADGEWPMPLGTAGHQVGYCL